jgi:hypothetical protein
MPPPDTRTGEIAGVHTVADLADMVRVALYEAGQVNSAVEACTEWLKADPAGFNDYASRVSATLNDLAKPLAAAQSLIDSVPEFLRGITPLLGSEYADLIAWRRRLHDLDGEFRAAPHGCVPPDYSKMPQPTAPDPDLTILHGTQAVTRPIDQGIASASALAQSRTPYLVMGALGALALVALTRRH